MFRGRKDDFFLMWETNENILFILTSSYFFGLNFKGMKIFLWVPESVEGPRHCASLTGGEVGLVLRGKKETSKGQSEPAWGFQLLDAWSLGATSFT